MQNFYNKYINIITIILITFFYSFNSNSLERSQIKIQGIKNIDKEIIFSIIGDYDINDKNDLNKIIDSLYQTGNFSNIQIDNTIKDQLTIIFDEFPIINLVNIEGNKRFTNDEIFENINKNKFLRFYNVSTINKFINELTNMYLAFGYNQIGITHESIYDKTNNLVDVSFKVTEGSISKINKVYFNGNNNFDPNQLFEVINSKPKNSILFFTKRNFKVFELDNDIIRIRDFYRKNGFKDTEVYYKTEFINEINSFNIYFYISENNKFLFNNFEIENNLSTLESEQISYLNIILNNYFKKSIKKNPVFNIKHLTNIKELLTDYLFSEGLNFFQIKILEDSVKNDVNIKFSINSTKPKYVREINILGNSRTHEKVVRRELLFNEGDTINDYLISESTNNLNNLNIFSEVSVKELMINNETVDLEINVKEKSTGDFQVGISFGTLKGATFVVGLNERNIYGSGRNLSFDVNTSADNTKYNIQVLEPHILAKKINLIYGLSYTVSDESAKLAYELENFESNIGISYNLTSDIYHKITLSYDIKDYAITDYSLVSSNVLASDGTNANFYLNNFLLSNFLDSNLRPSKGTYYSLTNKISPITNSTNGIFKNIILYKKYISLNRNIFSIQTKIGNISSLQNEEILNDEKFSLGGGWLRGFDIYGIGPRNSRSSFVGGNNIIASKFDFRKNILPKSDNALDLNFFADVGTIFGNKNNPTYSNETIRSSVGIGLNFYSPIGPVSFSWGFPIADEDYDIKRMFLFTIGGIN